MFKSPAASDSLLDSWRRKELGKEDSGKCGNITYLLYLQLCCFLLSFKCQRVCWLDLFVLKRNCSISSTALFHLHPGPPGTFSNTKNQTELLSHLFDGNRVYQVGIARWCRRADLHMSKWSRCSAYDHISPYTEAFRWEEQVELRSGSIFFFFWGNLGVLFLY